MAHNRKSKSRRRELEMADEGSGSERLQKVLAAAGLGSRRDCETLISEGRVEVDRVMVTELGSKVDPLTQDIRVDGVSLRRPKKVYFALNKPSGVLCTNFDPSYRTKVIDLIPTEERVFPVGRLDSGSEGLIIVTNDGELANRITHPRYGLDKTYFVRVAGNPSDEELLQLRRGIRLAEGFARVVGLKVRKRYSHHTDMELVLNEGKNREIRRLLAKVGHKVMLLRRTAVGPIRLSDLPLGASRKLLPKEVEELFEATHRRREAKATRDANSESDAPRLSPEANVVIKKKPRPEQVRTNESRTNEPRPEKAREGKPPVSESATSAPPKVDLAALLNPQTAPKQATLVTPLPVIPASAPTIGDVLGYEDDADASVPGYTPPAPLKPRKPIKGLEAKLAAEREANPDFMLTQHAAEAKDHIIRPREKGKKKFDASKLPPGRRADARRSSRPTAGNPASGSASAKFAPRRSEGNKPSGKPFGGKSSSGKPSGKKPFGGKSFTGKSPGGKPTGGRSNRPASGQASGGRSSGGRRGAAKNSRRGK